MKKIITLVLIVIIFTVVHLIQANAQTLKRIEFAKGRSAATIKGTTGSHGVTYVIRAKSGQKLILDLTPINRVGIKVETEGSYGKTILLREETGGTYEVGLEESGDYTIFIGSTNNKPVSFTLTVKTDKLADI